jgi:CheY-like chemotaxis protein
MEWKKLNTILLVDDDPINNFINQRLLEKMNIAGEVKVVMNGVEGIKCLHDHCFKTSISPDLILLDINMPIMVENPESLTMVIRLACILITVVNFAGFSRLS